ncbi:MAG: YciI family protein [Chryseosolibacter sp.]
MKTLLLITLLAFPVMHVLAQEKSYTIVFLNKKTESEKLDEKTTKKLMDGHMANIRRLAEEGKLLAAGPFDGGGGLFIFNTTSAEEAESWVNTDPAVQANRWDVEILPYTPRIGSVCPVSEPIEMVSYTFVRFDAVVDKFTAGTYPNIIRQHEAFMKEIADPAQIVTEAIFGPNEGGILIVKGELNGDAFTNDPGVQQGLLDVEIKKLYIAKSSFCEK